MVPMISIPTEVVLIDDQNDFLFSIEDCLNGKRHHFHLFSNANKAIKFINSRPCNLQFLKKMKEAQELQSYNQVSANFDYHCLHQEVFQEDRFDNISVVVVDYSMPIMNGLELLSQITNPHVKRILLTGEADEKIAVNAFNDGLIHQYIRKDSDYPTKLNAAIKQLSDEYWNDLTQPLHLILKNHFPVLPFDDPSFNLFFREILQKYNIVEYYLLDGSFRFLMIDERGNRFTLWIQTEAEAKSFAFEFQNSDAPDVPENVKNAVNEHRKIICLPFKNGILPHRSEWSKYIRDAKSIGEKFYAALTEAFDINIDYIPYNIKKTHHVMAQY